MPGPESGCTDDSPWPPRVLVLGADGRQGLTILRSLARKQVPVVAGITEDGVGIASRYAKRHARFKTGATERGEFAAQLRRVIATDEVTAVFPGPESAVIALDAVREEFPDLKLMLPARHALHIALDKEATRDFLQGLGIPVPETAVLSTCQDGRQFGRRFGYPVVLKPIARPSFTGGPPIFKVAYAGDEETLDNLVGRAESGGITLIAQTYAPGMKLQHGLLAEDGRILACYEFIGVRELPITGGVTTLHLSTPITTDIFSLTTRVIQSLAWTGLAGVEYRFDPRAGSFTLLEVNGRSWGSIAGAKDAGLDFPWLALLQAYGRTLPPVGPYRVVRTQDIIGDVGTWLRRSHVPEAFPESVPSSGRLLAAIIRDMLFAKAEYWAWDDPLPALLATKRVGATLLRAGHARLRGRTR